MTHNLSIKTYELDTLLFKENTSGLLEDNFLTYHTDTDTIRLNLSSFSFTKDNNDYTLKITPSSCLLYLKDLKNSIDIPLSYANFSYENNVININYKLETQEKPLTIIIEIGAEYHDL